MSLASSFAMLASLAASTPSDAERMIDNFVQVCTKGSGGFKAGTIRPVKFRHLPYSFREYFNDVKGGNYYYFSEIPHAYLIAYRFKDGTEVCAVSFDGEMSIADAQRAVRARLNLPNPGRVRPGRGVVDVDAQGRFEIEYTYLRNQNFATDSWAGPRYLVIQSLVYGTK